MKMNPKFSLFLILFFRILIAGYFSMSFYYTIFLAPASGGDEGLFVNDLVGIETNGWIAAIEKSISIPYMILAYPLSLFFQDYLALRFVNILLMVLLVLYFFKIAKIKTLDFYCYLFFYWATARSFFIGTNDALFFTGLIIFITEVFSFIENGKMNNATIAFSALVVSFFTRELFIVYFPVVALGVYFLMKNDFSFFNKKMLAPLLLFAFLLISNIPSLFTNHKLSYDDKIPPKNCNATWSQRQYLAQLMVNKGELKNFNHPSWEQTQDYLKVNGADSLPNGILQGLIFDYSLTFKEFFKDFYYSMFFGLRQLGLMLLFPFYFIVVNFKKSNILNEKLYIPYSLFLIFCIFSLIIISYIESRWYAAIYIVLIVFYSHHQNKNKIDFKIIQSNYLILGCFSIYGIYGLLHNFLRVV